MTRQMKRAALIVAGLINNGTDDETVSRVRASFCLLFWNEPGFNGSAFRIECNLVAALTPEARTERYGTV